MQLQGEFLETPLSGYSGVFFTRVSGILTVLIFLVSYLSVDVLAEISTAAISGFLT